MAPGGLTSALLWALAVSCAFASELYATSASSSSSSGSSSADTEVIVPRIGPTATQKSEDLSVPLPKIITLAALGFLGIFVVVALVVAMRKYRNGTWVNRYDSDVEQLESVTPSANRRQHDYY